MKDREKLEFILDWLSNNAELDVISEKNEALKDDASQLFIALDNLETYQQVINKFIP